MTTADHSQTRLLLASASPRRRELLGILGVQFEVAPADIDESVIAGESPFDYVSRMARSKAEKVLGRADGRRVASLGSDTAVVIDHRILGKPADRDAAIAMLTQLSGRRHQVLSAVALADTAGSACRLSVTDVLFRDISPAEMAAYWQTGEPADKAGAYGIQGLGACFVREIHGSYSGVVGLPLFETAELLNSKGYGPVPGVGIRQG